VAFENQTVRAAQAATAEISIVFMGVSDPVAAGFVHSVVRPGGNLTGFEAFTLELPDKKLELFKALIPHLRRVLVLHDPADPLTLSRLAELRTAGAALKLQLVEQAVTAQTEDFSPRACHVWSPPRHPEARCASSGPGHPPGLVSQGACLSTIGADDKSKLREIEFKGGMSVSLLEVLVLSTSPKLVKSLMWVWAGLHSHGMWVRKRDVIGQNNLCYWAATHSLPTKNPSITPGLLIILPLVSSLSPIA
jgi:hypothetical protein